MSDATETTALEDQPTLSARLRQLSLELEQRGWNRAAVKTCDDAADAIEGGPWDTKGRIDRAKGL